MDQADDFMALRPLLFSLAYQMTGSVADSEDIVSEAYVRLRRAELQDTEIASLKAYLCSVVTNLCIDHLKSARVRREAYVGTWLPEPLIDSAETPEFERVELSDTLSMAFLVLLETLTPTERAVFLLREVFEFDYPQIARVLNKSEASCRQQLSRARTHIDARKPRFDADVEQRERLAARFFAALEAGELEPLVSMLSEDVIGYGDGGGNGPSLPRPVNGRDKVMRLLAAVVEACRVYALRLEPALVNGQPGARMLDADGGLMNVLSLDILDGRIQTIRSVVNPDKLGHLGRLTDPGHPMRRGLRIDDSEASS
jgi:RNA polymerase sigma-70 factor (ECF subfamily)